MNIDPPAGGRSATKRASILQAASAAFLRCGYDGITMDEIAVAARVSKQTLYKQFSDKETLFLAVMLRAVTEASDMVHAAALGFRDSGDLEGDLRALARKLLSLVMTPHILQLRRIAIAMADRIPALGSAFYDAGAKRTIAALAELLERLSERGLLRIKDPRMAAAHLNWLVVSIPINTVMFLGASSAPSQRELNRFADEGVSVFVAAFAADRAVT